MNLSPEGWRVGEYPPCSIQHNARAAPRYGPVELFFITISPIMFHLVSLSQVTFGWLVWGCETDLDRRLGLGGVAGVFEVVLRFP